MDKYDYSAIERELALQKIVIQYLQEEQKKRWEELDQIKKDLKKLENNPKFKKLVKLAAKKN